MLNKYLFGHIDNSPLLVFRIIFGLLIAMECFGAMLTGWVKNTLVEPEFTFHFIGFDFLQPLSGPGMYFYFAIMGTLGLMVMLGYRYKWSLGLFTLLWTAVYLMQKASYNNHYYLLILVCLLMLLMPANRNVSLDARLNPKIREISMPRWCSLIIILQIWIVYTYAAIAKLYPDWLDLSVIEVLMKGKKDYPVIGDFLQQHWLHVFIAYSGILFDLLIVPVLLWRPTRIFGLICSLVFHLFNAIVFQIGIFPFLSLAFILFFFDTSVVHRIFLKKHKEYYAGNDVEIPLYKKLWLSLGIVYFLLQLALPLRHWFISGDVLWTEEGHRLSWRMMLRSKSGYIEFKVVDKNTGKTELVRPNTRLSGKQRSIIATKPDVIWQFAQRLAGEYKMQGKEVEIYAIGKVSVNGSELMPLIDPKVDLASVKWQAFRHSEWIMPYKKRLSELR